jgi:hypothetical protein
MTALENDLAWPDEPAGRSEHPAKARESRRRPLPDLDQLAQRFRENPEALAAALAELLELGDREVGARGRAGDSGP